MHRLKTVVGDYEHTAALRAAGGTPAFALNFIEVRPIGACFNDMVRHQRYDVCELALGAYFQARSQGAPIRILPVVNLAGFLHANILYNPDRGRIAPKELSGGRIGVRAYSQTTAVWARGLLQEDYGVRHEDVTWVTTDEPHVVESVDPPNVVRADNGLSLVDLLRAGEVQAIILHPSQTPEPWCAPVIADPQAAARDWYERHAFFPVNHVVSAGPAVLAQPGLAAELTAHLRSIYTRAMAAGEPAPAQRLTADRGMLERALAYAVDLATDQGLVPAGVLDPQDLFAPGV